MTSKAVLKLAEELLDRAFREAEGQPDRKVDLVLLVEEVRASLEKAEPALEYLHSRGLIHPPTGDSVYLTSRGVEAVATEQDIKVMPKFEQVWGGAPAVAAPAGPPRPYRPMLSFVDPQGAIQTFDLGWIATVGRSDEATLTLPDPRASKRHVELKYAGDRYLVRDLGSANGTMLNGTYVETQGLSHGDVLLIGRTEVTYTCPEVLPEPHGEPPPELASARPRPPVVGEPTARPEPVARIEPAASASSMPSSVRVAAAPALRVEPVTAPLRIDPAMARPEPMPSGEHRRPDASSALSSGEHRREPLPPMPAAEPRRPEPEIVRGVRTPPRPVAPVTAAAASAASAMPPQAGGPPRRRTAPVVDVPIVKGRPELAPAAAVVDPSGLFEASPTPARPSGDLFGDAPTLTPPPKLVTGSPLPPPSATPRAPLFEPDTVSVQAPGGDLFAPDAAPALSAPVPKGDLFESNTVAAAAPAGLFEARPAAPDLFAPATPPSAHTSGQGADPLAARDDQGPSDLFAADYGAAARHPGPRAPDLFAEPEALPAEPLEDLEELGTRAGSLSPLPLGTARAPEDLLPLDQPTADLPADELPPLDLSLESGVAEAPLMLDMPLEEPVSFEEPVLLEEPASFEPPATLDAPSDASDATMAGISPFLARAAALDVALPDEPSGRTSELPAWDRAGDSSLAPFADADPGALMVGPPDTSGFDERTPVEEAPEPAAPAQILAAATDLPEAPSALEDLSGDVITPVAWGRFAETLAILRTRLADAGVPDQARLVDAIELLRKHPSVRAALTEP